jgi:arylsulfatase A-like enzyme
VDRRSYRVARGSRVEPWQRSAVPMTFTKMKRFVLATTSALFLFGGFALLSCVTCAAELRRPNVLWICGDDHAPYVIGAYSNRQVRTPDLDKLSAQGMRFDRAYCNSPVCTASRQSFLTGRYPRTVGVTQLKTALPESEVTLAEMLKAAGYATAAFGKMHFNSELKHGFDRRIDQPEYKTWLNRKIRTPLPDPIETQPVWKPFRDPARIWLNARNLPLGSVDGEMFGTFLADEATQYLLHARTEPFFLMVSFTEPHSPFHFPIEYRNRHRPSDFSAPKLAQVDEAQVPEVFRGLTEPDKQGIVAAYYNSVEFLDKNIGRVLEALDKSGQAQDTIVIYTGDHGYMLGQHGRFEKHCGYEPAVRAPLMIRFPDRVKPGQHSPALVELIDIVPTILEWLRVPIPSSVQGRSLVPVLTGQAAKHRERVVSEYSENEEAYIVTERWKFIYGTGRRLREDGYATGRPLPGRTLQLFDLQNDPEELLNLANHRAHQKEILAFTVELAEHMKRTAREPELIPKSDDPHAILEFCLKPRDVTPAASR